MSLRGDARVRGRKNDSDPDRDYDGARVPLKNFDAHGFRARLYEGSQKRYYPVTESVRRNAAVAQTGGYDGFTTDVFCSDHSVERDPGPHCAGGFSGVDIGNG
jgi:hypothetical protein